MITLILFTIIYLPLGVIFSLTKRYDSKPPRRYGRRRRRRW